MGAVDGEAGQGAPRGLLERLLASPLGRSGAVAPFLVGAPAAAALPARAATTAGAPGWSPTGARTRFGHSVRIVPCAWSGDVRGVRGNRPRH